MCSSIIIANANRPWILPAIALQASTNDNDNDDTSSADDNEEDGSNDGIDLSLDERLYRVRLSRFPGIEWGTDLSFAFVYVRALDPSGAASMSGQVAVGDQLCELRAVIDSDSNKPVNLLGAPFDYVMTAFATLEKGVQDVELVFFRGSQEDLKAVCTGEGAKKESDTVTITVIQNKGSPEENIQTITAPAGCNVREVLTDNKINVYQSITRWTNCKGKQLCGTCIVDITEGSGQTNRKSMDEASTLRENPDSYRLSCVTFAYGDITVETFPPIEAAQWTR
ncbi:Ferredoxin [Seminavis robusta]|uniref:Ferredoxin n=1 Tax=Seminavis robusta TaxID=568900 RepID=A0A9N8H5T2_9STRA|nr:Ferredoxin [Seminavis robusta]|eukprot:Sro82_g043900.1 Ferredoxin (281) ;mRNA; f:75313-76155